MNSKRIALGIGIALLVVAVFTAHATAHRAYFVPQHSNATTGNTTTMDLYVEIDAGETLLSGQVQIQFDPTHAMVINNYLLCGYYAPTGPDQYCWNNFVTDSDYERSGYMWSVVYAPRVSEYSDFPVPGWYWVVPPGDGLIQGPATVPVGTYVIEAYGTPGVSPFNFGFDQFPTGCPICKDTLFFDPSGQGIDMNWENGTFTHEGEIPSQTFTKSLAPGWNLISLPLTPTDSSTGAVLGNATIVYDAVNSYNATSKLFETATTMDPGTGYFVHVTTAGIWEYEGTPETSTSPGLKSGLNMIGVPNCTMSVSDAMGPATDYRYVARWNADDQKYEVYNPSAPAAFHGVTTMTAGEGYFVSAKSDDGAFAISCP